MTTYHYTDGVFYADTRAYMNGQAFNISGKIVPLHIPIKMKATLNKGTVKPIILDEMVYGYFILHAADPGRALFNTMVAAATASDGDVQSVLDNHAMFLETFKLAAFDSHFVLYVIGETGVYSITTPSAIYQETTYTFTPYENEEFGSSNQLAFGANHEWFTAHISAGIDPVIAYYLLFLQHHESGGHIESWKFHSHKGKKALVRYEFFEEVSEKHMKDAVIAYRKDHSQSPVADLSSIFQWGPSVLSSTLITRFMEGKKFKFTYDDRGIVSHVTLPNGETVALQAGTSNTSPPEEKSKKVVK
jgi:hypothetical protein